LISNIYSWIFPAAIFVAAGLSNLITRVKRKHNPSRAGHNKIVWFSINISIAIALLAASVFFVDWRAIDWSQTHLYFSLTIFVVFFISFVFKFITGIPIILVLVIILFFRVYIQDWKEISPGDIIAEYRILSNDQGRLKAEVYMSEQSVLFIEGAESNLSLSFEALEMDKTMFFVPHKYYFRLMDSPSPIGISGEIINFLSGKTFLLDNKVYSVNILGSDLLHKYSVVYKGEPGNIFIEN
jgi:hypothetical protein